MKTIKVLFAVLFVSSMFIACENDNINEELNQEELENIEINAEEGDEEEVDA